MTSIRTSLPSRKTFLGKTFDITSRELDTITNKHMKENPPSARKPFAERRSTRRRAKVEATKNRVKLDVGANTDSIDPTNRRYPFRAGKGNQAVEGILSYRPQGGEFYGETRPHLEVNEIWKRGATDASHFKSHKINANKTMSTSFTKELLKKAAKQFPKAEVLVGTRVTGIKGRHEGIQSFNLNRLRGIASKVGRGAKFFAPMDVITGALEMRQGDKIRKQRQMKQGLIPGRT